MIMNYGRYLGFYYDGTFSQIENWFNFFTTFSILVLGDRVLWAGEN